MSGEGPAYPLIGAVKNAASPVPLEFAVARADLTNGESVVILQVCTPTGPQIFFVPLHQAQWLHEQLGKAASPVLVAPASAIGQLNAQKVNGKGR